MIERLRRFFGLRDRVVFVEIPIEISLNEEAKAAVTRLPDHPGFQYLMQVLRRHKAALNLALRTCESKDVLRLQEAIRWSAWLETFVNHECKVQSSKRKEVSISDREKEILAASLANISVIE